MKRPTLPLFLLLVLAEVLFVGISPLLPVYAQRLHLSALSDAELLASTSLALLLVAIPAGLVADRVGLRRMTLLSTAVLCLGSAAEAAPISFAWLLSARTLIGLAAGVFFTTSLAWLARVTPGRQSPLGVGMTMSGIGIVLGPGFVGLLAQRYGLGAPFVAISLLSGVGVLALASTRGGDRGMPDARPLSALSALGAAFQRRQVWCALSALSASAIAAGAISVILPLELQHDGASTSAIGLVLLVTGVGRIGMSLLVARSRAPVASLQTATIAGAILGCSLLPGDLSRSVAALVLTTALIMPLRGVVETLCFQLAPGWAGGGVPAASIIGCLNSVWGAVSVAAPLAAGVIFDVWGGPTAFMAAQIATLGAAGAAIVVLRRLDATQLST